MLLVLHRGGKEHKLKSLLKSSLASDDLPDVVVSNLSNKRNAETEFNVLAAPVITYNKKRKYYSYIENINIGR